MNRTGRPRRSQSIGQLDRGVRSARHVSNAEPWNQHVQSWVVGEGGVYGELDGAEPRDQSVRRPVLARGGCVFEDIGVAAFAPTVLEVVGERVDAGGRRRPRRCRDTRRDRRGGQVGDPRASRAAGSARRGRDPPRRLPDNARGTSRRRRTRSDYGRWGHVGQPSPSNGSRPLIAESGYCDDVPRLGRRAGGETGPRVAHGADSGPTGPFRLLEHPGSTAGTSVHRSARAVEAAPRRRSTSPAGDSVARYRARTCRAAHRGERRALPATRRNWLGAGGGGPVRSTWPANASCARAGASSTSRDS